MKRWQSSTHKVASVPFGKKPNLKKILRLTISTGILIGDDGEQDEYEFDMRMIYPDTMDRLLHKGGFIIEEKWGDYDGEPFDETSLLQLYICSKR